MDRAEREFRMDEVRCLVECFFSQISENQWKQLVIGCPDNVTQIQLAELILSIIESVTKTLLAAITNTTQPESKIQAMDTLDDMLPNSFSEALGIPEEDDNGSLKSLSEMIRTEVTENIDSALSTRSPYIQPVINQRIVPPARVNTMVNRASEVFKKFAAMLKGLFSPKVRKQEVNQFETVESYQLAQRIVQTEVIEEPGEEIEYQEEAMAVEPEIPQDPGGPRAQVDSGETEILEFTSDENFIRKASEMLQSQIRTELRKLVLPILDNSETEFEMLNDEASLELQSLSLQIANSICSGERKSLPLVRGRIRIRDFLARCLSKALICRLCEKIKRAYPQHTQDASRESLESLLTVVYSWLQTDVSRNQEADKEDSLVSWFNISSNKALIFAKQLSDLIYRYVLGDSPQSANVGMLGVPEAHDEMFADILGKVWVFVVLMNWWMNSQGQMISERIKMPLMYALLDTTERDAVMRKEKNRCCVKFFVEKIVHHVFLDVRMMPDNKHDIINFLFENVWAAVQGADLYITQETFKGLGRKIDRVLYRRWGTPELALFAVTSRDPLIEQCIITIIKEQLMKPPKKPSSFRRFFSRTKSSPRP